MHVFIDTNILLNFFHFTQDDLDTLRDAFASHEHGAATVYLTQQVCDEFRRNRENKIKDALKKFKDAKFSAQLPSFMKQYAEYDEIRNLSKKLQDSSKKILEKVELDVKKEALAADKLFADIFDRATTENISDEVFLKAKRRFSLGNPPGKSGSLGDAINWTILLEKVPECEPLHIISEDGDFYSLFDENAINPFLEDEWKLKKKSEIRVYRTLTAFMTEHFNGIAFSFDKNKDALIEDLVYSPNFAYTHKLISQLETYSYFSLKEVEKILNAAVVNNQFSWIISDDDVSDFLNRIAVPQLSSLNLAEHRNIIESVIEDQAKRSNSE